MTLVRNSVLFPDILRPDQVDCEDDDSYERLSFLWQRAFFSGSLLASFQDKRITNLVVCLAAVSVIFVTLAPQSISFCLLIPIAVYFGSMRYLRRVVSWRIRDYQNLLETVSRQERGY